MRKNILLALAAVAFVASAQVADISTRWCKMLDAAPPDMGIDMTMHDGSLFFLSNTGSTIGDGSSGFPKEYADPTKSIYYDGQLVGIGAAYEGASYNNNFNLIKTNLDGNLQWCVYSTNADIASNNGGVVAAPDGGVYVSVVLRQTDNLRTEPIRFVDATGSETIIDWRLPDNESSRWFQGLLMKVSKDGAILWTRMIEVENTIIDPAGQPAHAGTAFYITGMESDPRGNFYVTGRYVTPITLLKADGRFTLTPHNTDGWNGDSQQSRGDVFVAKFDTDGYLMQTLTTTGVASLETSSTLAWCDDDLILNFSAKGEAQGSTIALDEHEITLPNQASLVTACVDTDMNVKWAQLFRGDQCGGRVSVFQNNHVQVFDDAMWITGQGNFTLYSEDGSQSIATRTGTVREGFVIKCDKNTGKWIKAACSKQGALEQLNGICGYFGGFESEDGTKFYAYGYSFASQVIETDDDILVEGYGVILVEHDATTLETTDFCSLIAGGSMSTAQECIATGDKLYALARGRNINQPEYALKPINSDMRLETKEWAALFAGFNLPFAVKEVSRPTAVVTADINGDGIADVADVNIAINVMLGREVNAEADINHDGFTDVSDVNLVINAMLGR